MNTYLRFFLATASAMLFVSNSVVADQTTVTVTTSENAGRTYTVTFNTPPRISQLVSQSTALVRADTKKALAHNTDTIYWQGAGLFDNANSEDLATLKVSVNNGITILKEEWSDDKERLAALNAFSDFVAKSTFLPRIHVPLDEDYYLAGSKVNPLVHGQLTLLLPSRPNNIWVVGAVTSPTNTDFHPGYVAGDYVKLADTLNTFGISEVSVIQPNGTLETHPIAYWNEVPKSIAPGAVIFVPFQGLPSELSSLNRDIPRLLQHRVM